MNFIYDDTPLMRRWGLTVLGFGLWFTLGENYAQLTWGRVQ